MITALPVLMPRALISVATLGRDSKITAITPMGTRFLARRRPLAGSCVEYLASGSGGRPRRGSRRHAGHLLG
jgi:hypothetical protein